MSTTTEIQHTVPTSEELTRMVRKATFFYAGKRDGGAFYECYKVQDGVAYRPYGSAENAEWEWRRPADFFDLCLPLFRVDEDAYKHAVKTLVGTVDKWRGRYQAAWRAMGKKSRNRLLRRINRDAGD